ncbi:PKD domain-containing protein [Candidatus Woesearchaeota archaeon]|nr:PKD domain-containing protein [Candidatus Woesearchaeota archaeon]
MMNFKTQFLVLLTISVFLLSGCEVYQTLYGTTPQTAPVAAQVVRVEGEQAKDVANLAKQVYGAAAPTQHDPFKVGQNPLGPFEKGKGLGFTLQQWLAASGIGIYSVDGQNAELELSLKNLVPNGIYTVWCSSSSFPPNFSVVDKPCGAEDGSENSLKADEKGNGQFSLKVKALEQSTKEKATIIALAYHSDGKTYGSSPGDFGTNTHVQIFFLLPIQTEEQAKYQIPIKFVNHIDAGLPEQDVFIEHIAPQEEAPKEEMKAEEPAMEKPEEQAKGEKEETVKVEERPKEKELVEEKPREKPIVVVVQETDLVSLTPKAEDPDKETNLVFTFTSPLNEKGEWQTNYGDAGEYTITVTASDSETTTSRDVLIIVNKKEESPAIDSAKPIESGLTIDETQSIEFSAVASDLNKDILAYSWKLDGVDVGTDSKYSYQSTYDDAGTHTVKVEVSDGLSSASKIWSVDVGNVNRKPALEKMEDINIKETDKIVVTALATDDDKDKITYSVSDKKFAQEDNVFTWQTDYESAGTYQITVSASDGQDTTSQEFTVTVANVNRAPLITDIVQKS